MVTQAHSQKSCIMRTAHVMLNLAKYRIMLSLHYIEEHNIAEHHIARVYIAEEIIASHSIEYLYKTVYYSTVWPSISK